MIISIASGKGGTGKTTVAANLAYSIGSDVQILDCDVEEPNAHLFLNLEIEQTKTAYTSLPEIDEEKCNLCRKCSDICRFNVIAIISKTILTFPQLCHSCGGCIAVCSENAITEIDRELGIIEQGRSNDIKFVHGCLRVGEGMSPPLIKKVRSYINTDKINIIDIDAPPGTSCPVIAAMIDSDFVLMVTQTNPFWSHD